MFGKAFGAVAALEQKTPALADFGKLFLELTRLTCKTSGG
jgi:hypothetical protein